jgi:hypothetical protein
MELEAVSGADEGQDSAVETEGERGELLADLPLRVEPLKAVELGPSGGVVLFQ